MQFPGQIYVQFNTQEPGNFFDVLQASNRVFLTVFRSNASQ
jgi:hypothetical protein